MTSNTKTMRACYVNCQSLMAHLDEFMTFFVNSPYDIICLSETWLKPAILDCSVSLPGYQLFRCDRVGKRGGGVAFYLTTSNQAKILKSSESKYSKKPEYLIAEIVTASHSKILLAVVYRPPHCGHLGDFFNVFYDLSIHYKHSIIFGDFNADMNTSTFDSEQICSYTRAHNMFLVPFSPTYHTQISSTFLDLCLIDNVDNLISFNQRDVCFLSSHDLIEINYNISIRRIQKSTITVRDFNSFDNNKFLNDLSNYDWSRLLNTNDINHKVYLFNHYLLTCFDENAPIKTIQLRHLPAPWLTADIKVRMSERDRACRRWRRSKSVANYAQYKLLRNQVQTIVRSAKEEYYLATFSKLKDPNSIWKQLRKIGLVKTKTTEHTLPFSIKELNQYFSTRSQLSSVGDAIDLKYINESNYDDTRLYWRNVEFSDVINALHRNKSNAVGKDRLSIGLIKIALPQILPFITHIFNFSLNHGIFPSIWKSAIVCPVPKTKSPSELQHFRPISILCHLEGTGMYCSNSDD